MPRAICKCLLIVLLAASMTRPATALVEPFDPTMIMTDEEFGAVNAMSCGEIQIFLEQRAGILKSHFDAGKSAAQHICEQAAAFAINPRLLIVLAQKEMALITDPQPDQAQTDWAAGCGPGWQSTRGFATQMACAARTLRKNFDRPASDPSASIDGIIPANRATLALYRYTTHVAGNRNFWKIWTNWFPAGGSPPVTAAAPVPESQALPVLPAIDAEIVIDSRAAALSPAPRPGSAPCKLGWTSTARGLGGHHWLTPNVASAAESTNMAVWRPEIPREGRYQVFAFVPAHSARVPWQCGGIAARNDTSNALYVIQHRDGISQVVIDQTPLNNVWADLGAYYFGAGSAGAVSLSDLTGEPSNAYWVNIDELKFVPAP